MFTILLFVDKCFLKIYLSFNDFKCFNKIKYSFFVIFSFLLFGVCLTISPFNKTKNLSA